MSSHVVIKQGLRREHTSIIIEKVPRTPGVYHIFYGDKTIYVGVTGNLRKKLLELSGNPKIRFGTFSWYQTKSRADAEIFEQHLKEQERATFSLLELSIQTFSNWNEKGILNLSPKFQRLKVWKPIAKSYFLDTIIRGLPSPHVYIRDILLPQGITQHQVVDGQQRLRAILEYLSDQITIMKRHNKVFGDILFSNLPNDVKAKILSYKIPVQLLQNATDLEVLDIFARLNTYNVRLNAQELRNAKYDGAFKRCIYTLADKNRKFFIENKILYPHHIVRMTDAELVSEIIISMMDGLQNAKQTIELFYDRYDNKFSEANTLSTKFMNVISEIENIFGEAIRKTRFKRKSLFYTLFCVMYHILYGLPKEGEQLGKISSEYYEETRNILYYLSQQLIETMPDEKFSQFVQASQRRTDDLVPRKIRHAILLDELKGYIT